MTSQKKIDMARTQSTIRKRAKRTSDTTVETTTVQEMAVFNHLYGL